jgi:hypothetical protein
VPSKRVNTVSPGATDTPELSDLFASAEAGRERLKMISTVDGGFSQV